MHHMSEKYLIHLDELKEENTLQKEATPTVIN
jgi:hypothetical protein